MDASPRLTSDALRMAQPSAAGPQTWRLAAGGTVELQRDGNGRVRLSVNYNHHELTERESTLVCQLIDVAAGRR